ncbi:MAG: hypothetical protein OEZ32_12595 [Nitrospinota bacterium]|nr:hypothetical protein [Nitrospinota bacterium]
MKHFEKIPSFLAICSLLAILVATSSCQYMQPVIDGLAREEADCKARGGVYLLGQGCKMPEESKPDPMPEPMPEPMPPMEPPKPTPPPPGGDACASLGHGAPALFQKSMDLPAKRFTVNPAELEGKTLVKGRLTAEVTGFGALAQPERDSFLLIMETVHPDSPYKIVFSADTWRQGDNMFTRWTAQHFPTGARTPRKEPMDQFEHWIFPTSRYLYDCQWDRSGAVCRVHEIGTGWTARTETPFLKSMGVLARPLVFGDMAHEAYQSIGPDAMVLRACISVY